MSAPSNSASQSTRPRRWFRYSLRTLLLVMTIICICLGWVVSRVLQQERAVKAIESAGGSVTYDWQHDSRARSNREGPHPRGPQWLRDLIGRHYFDTVVDVRFWRGDMARAHGQFAEVAPCLANLPRLRFLSLTGLALGENEFAMVAKYSSSEELICYMMELRDRDAAQLAGAAPLRKLGLNDVKISAKGIAEFKRLPQLEEFWLACHFEDPGPDGALAPSHTYCIGDDAVPGILEFSSLRSLGLTATLMTDDGVAMLCKMQRLESLRIHSWNITSAALEHIAKLKRLTWLDVGGSAFDGQRLDKLQELPRLTGLVLGGKLTNDDLATVARLQQLERLHLTAYEVDDRGLPFLASMKRLKSLDLQSTSVTPDGPAVKQLQQALPACNIQTWHPSVSGLH